VLRAASNGDAEARSKSSRSYAVVIRSYLEARWHGRLLASELDDATQEMFIECLKPGGVLDQADASGGDFRGLLYGVVRNVARRFEERALQRGKRIPKDSDEYEQLPADDPGQATLFDRSWARALIRQGKRL
jgi:hypothetical protein